MDIRHRKMVYIRVYLFLLYIHFFQRVNWESV